MKNVLFGPLVFLLVFLTPLLASCDIFLHSGTAIPVRTWSDTNPINKRGVAYNFTTNSTNINNGPASTTDTDADMDLLTPAVKWFYNWGISASDAVAQAAAEHNLDFYPMAWNDVNETALRGYVAAHPECEYIMAYNEPNLTDQANMTPAQAAAKWPRLKALAGELNLKIVSPAMNYGTLENYGDPIKWLDEFFRQPGVSLDDVCAIAVHCYMQDPAAMKGYIQLFKKYKKPIWVTEFCAWEKIQNAEQQMKYMSEIVTYMELSPQIEKYSWFIPKSGGAGVYNDKVPFNNLLTITEPPELTALGTVYANMGTCDMTVWHPAGERIPAAQFSNCNTWVSVFTAGLSDSVHFRPGTDPDGEALDIYDFTNNKWVEYQADVPETNTWSLTVRNKAASDTRMEISVDGKLKSGLTLTKSNVWLSSEVLLALSAGLHTIRLKVTNGSCALNWLELAQIDLLQVTSG
ncbi:MAG: glycosyl hydrolase [Treponema sp.]|nr:glycosyl hydrolase [Treponema sp.]